MYHDISILSRGKDGCLGKPALTSQLQTTVKVTEQRVEESNWVTYVKPAPVNLNSNPQNILYRGGLYDYTCTS